MRTQARMKVLSVEMTVLWTILLTVCAQTIVYEKPAAWYQAYLKCRWNTYSLPIPKATTFSDLDNILPSNGSQIWIGGRFVHTSWRWADGCGVMRSEGCAETSDLSYNVNFSADTPFDCFLLCRTALVALQGSTCYCLNSTPTYFAKQKECHLRCAANFDQQCGGLTKGSYASVYARHNSFLEWDDNLIYSIYDCGYLYLKTLDSHTMNGVRLRTSACDERSDATGFKMILCQNCVDPGHNNCSWRNTSYVPWTGADQFCKDHGGELLNVRTNQSLPLLFSPNIQEDYWVALKRDFEPRWLNGSKAVKVTNEDGFCMAAKRGNNGGVIITAVDCSKQLSFLCLKDTEQDAVFPDSPQDQQEFCKSSSPQTAGSGSTSSIASFTPSVAATATTGSGTSNTGSSSFSTGFTPSADTTATTSLGGSGTSNTGSSTGSGMNGSRTSNTGLRSSISSSTNPATLLVNANNTASLHATPTTSTQITTTANKQLSDASSTILEMTTATKTSSLATTYPSHDIVSSSTTAAAVSTVTVTERSPGTTSEESTKETGTTSEASTEETRTTSEVLTEETRTSSEASTEKKWTSQHSTLTTSWTEPAPEMTESTLNTGRTDPPIRKDDLLPLYIIIGILFGVAMVVFAILVGWFRYRSRRSESLRQSRADSRTLAEMPDSPDHLQPGWSDGSGPDTAQNPNYQNKLKPN